ncbi:MAG TPA: hypothetical protein PKM25_18860 [Candidatus Ozemobacteraceae bacterium]|nr:hypothetical protein [Candidatus Ozemobacteraceae bacterium]
MSIDALLRDRLLGGLQRLTLLYGELAENARSLLEITEASSDRVLQILDHRDLALLEVKDVELELVSALNESRAANSAFGLAQVVEALEGGAMPALEGVVRFKSALKTLVEVDEAVQKKFKETHAGLDAEIKRLRRGSSLVRGYRQADPMGSAFIDKIK